MSHERRCTRDFEPIVCRCTLVPDRPHRVATYSTWRNHRAYLQAYGESQLYDIDQDLDRDDDIERDRSPAMESEPEIDNDSDAPRMSDSDSAGEYESGDADDAGNPFNEDSDLDRIQDYESDFSQAMSLISGMERSQTMAAHNPVATEDSTHNRQLSSEEQDDFFNSVPPIIPPYPTVTLEDVLDEEFDLPGTNPNLVDEVSSSVGSEILYPSTPSMSSEHEDEDSDTHEDTVIPDLPTGLKFLEKCACQPFTIRELLSYALYDTKTSKGVSRDAMSDIEFMLRGLSDIKPYDYRTTEKRLQERTGIEPISYDCCINSCFCYADSELVACPTCKHPRFKLDDNGKKTPYERFVYIPLTSRLRLQYANPRRAAKFIRYRKLIQLRGYVSQQKIRQENTATELASHINDGVYDWWNGELCQHLVQEKGLFDCETDIAMTFSTDGVTIFESNSPFSVWPLVLTNMNLPPSERVKEENLLLAGVIPGPKAPVNLDSFLIPLVEEFLMLEKGVAAWNGNQKTPFVLKAHIVIVSADQPAREKLMGMMGGGTYCNCFYCNSKGIHNGQAVYYPFTPPTDVPLAQLQKITAAGRNLTKYNPAELPMRSDYLHRMQATMADAQVPNSKSVQKDHGVKRLPILSRLKSIDFPRSFPIDAMHLFYANVVPDLFKHFRGRFFKASAGQQEENARNEGNNLNNGVQTVPPKLRKDKKFEATDDAYNVKPAAWAQIGKDMHASRGLIPGKFGENVRDITKCYHLFKSSEWSKFAHVYSPVYLKSYLPSNIYNAYIGLVDAMGIACDYEFMASDIQKCRNLIVKFLNMYEQEFYQLKYNRMGAMLSVFHILAHVPDCMQWNGPMRSYWQFPMERVVGVLSANVASRVDPNSNMANKILQREWLNNVLFTDINSEYIWNNTADKTLSKTLIRILVAKRDKIDLLPLLNQEPTTANRGLLKRQREPMDLLDGKKIEVQMDNTCRDCVFNLIVSEGNVIMKSQIPTTMKTWGRLYISDDVEVSSMNRKVENSTRDSTTVRYEAMGTKGQITSRYGQVIQFFTVDISGGENKFAFIKEIKIHKEGRLLYKAPGGAKFVVRVECIKELVGRIICDKKEYIIASDTSLIA